MAATLPRIAGPAAVVGFALTFLAFTPADTTRPPAGITATAAHPAPPAGAVTDNVIVISIDGLRPDAIELFDAHVLQRMMREGAYSRDARTILPSKTLPSHTSMLTGVPPDVHGVTWNTDRSGEKGTVQVATVFELARDRGFGTAAFFSKAKMRHLAKPGTLDHSQAPSGKHVYTAMATVEATARYIRFRQPNLTFVHIAEPDVAGHSFGWMSFAYGWAVRRADAGVGRILEAADAAYGEGNYSVIITADHGGHARSHGEDTDEDVLIPWIAWGQGVAAGEMRGPVSTMDTATTVLWLLGITAPADWHGMAVAQAYTPGARLAAAAAVAVE